MFLPLAFLTVFAASLESGMGADMMGSMMGGTSHMHGMDTMDIHSHHRCCTHDIWNAMMYVTEVMLKSGETTPSVNQVNPLPVLCILQRLEYRLRQHIKDSFAQIAAFLLVTLTETGLLGEIPPVRPGNHKLSHLSKPGIEPGTQWWEARTLTFGRVGQLKKSKCKSK